MQCSQCGTEVQSEFQFCPSCGQPVPTPTIQEEPAPTVMDVPSRTEWILSIMSGEDQGSSFVIDDKLEIGRMAECDVILKDEKVSRRHATVERTGDDTFRLVDHDSSNGTFVQEERIEGTAVLVAGVTFRVGDTEMTLVPTFESCPRCGQSIEGSETFCGSCGHQLGTDVEFDVEKMAAEMEQAASGGVAQVGKSVPSSGTPSRSRFNFSALRDKFSELMTDPKKRWVGIGCVVLVALLGAATFCGMAIRLILDYY